MVKKIILFTGCLFFFMNCQSKDNWTKAGDMGEYLLPATAFAMTFYKHDKDGRKMFYKSYLSSMALNVALKISVHDERPNGGGRAYISGHTAAAFSGAAFMQRRYGWKMGAPSYVFASYVGWSRLHAEQHDLDDVVRGAAIGIVGAYYFTKPIGKHAVMYPILEPGKYGLMVSARW